MSKIVKKKISNNKKKYSVFLDIRNMQFDQGSQVQPNPEKKIQKNLKKSLQKETEKFENIFLPKKNATLLVLLVDEISLWPELPSPAHFRIQEGPLSVTYIGAVAAAAAGLVAGRYF